jgi:hypothetical protein
MPKPVAKKSNSITNQTNYNKVNPNPSLVGGDKNRDR